jgi:pimeloyl-ACP methyl ester carboxylesterase
MPFARCHSAGRVHYSERGESRPDHYPFLLIHGAGASSAIWMMVMARLGRVSRAVAIDLPGHGPSPAFHTAFDTAFDSTFDYKPVPALTDYRDAAGELAALTGLGPSVLIGHSMGALVAIEAALAWPDKVKGLLLCAAAPRLPVSRELLAAIDQDYANFPAWLAERAFSASAKPALRRAFVAAGVVAPQEVTRADFQAIAGATDLRPRLGQISCPVIWLDGADDTIVSDSDRAGRSEIAGSCRTLSAVGHLIPIEAPTDVAHEAVTLSRRRPNL